LIVMLLHTPEARNLKTLCRRTLHWRRRSHGNRRRARRALIGAIERRCGWRER
jgi:hypothetical protein